MATSLGKMVTVVEIGPYRGVQAVVNGQEFAITSRINSGWCRCCARVVACATLTPSTCRII